MISESLAASSHSHDYHLAFSREEVVCFLSQILLRLNRALGPSLYADSDSYFWLVRLESKLCANEGKGLFLPSNMSDLCCVAKLLRRVQRLNNE